MINNINFRGTLTTPQQTVKTTDDNDRLLLFGVSGTLNMSERSDFNEVSRKDGVFTSKGKLNQQGALDIFMSIFKEVSIDKDSMPVLGDKINVVISDNTLEVECENKFSWKVDKNDTNGIFNEGMGDRSFLLRAIGKIFDL